MRTGLSCAAWEENGYKRKGRPRRDVAALRLFVKLSGCDFSEIMAPMHRRLIISLSCLLVAAAPLCAHPVPSSSFDRIILVSLHRDRVQVEYKLEVNPLTVYLQIARLLSSAEQAQLKGAKDAQFYEAFTTAIAPVIADGLEAWQGQQPLTFRCEKKSWSSEHNIVCTFLFSAPWPSPPGSTVRFRLEENNFKDQRGTVDLAFAAQHGGELSNVEQATSELKSKPAVERTSLEEAKLKSLRAEFSPASDAAPVIAAADTPAEPRPSFWHRLRERGLIALLDLRGGLLVVLLGSIIFGAVHALQPGHGKTLVAAYLVGERGTTMHALSLGLVTTITHTGVVLMISVILWLAGNRISTERIQSVLSFISGAMVAGLGVWLLLRRLAGQADHFHFFGGKHHHHGPDGHHHLPSPAQGGVRWWNLIMLGIGGGIVPCWDAIVLQIYVTAKGELWLGPPIILAFSAGLAATLVAIGILVVKLKGFGASRWGKGRFIKSLPIASAILITALGIWLIVDAAGR